MYGAFSGEGAGICEKKRGVTPYYVSTYCFQKSRFRVSLDICRHNIFINNIMNYPAMLYLRHNVRFSTVFD